MKKKMLPYNQVCTGQIPIAFTGKYQKYSDSDHQLFLFSFRSGINQIHFTQSLIEKYLAPLRFDSSREICVWRRSTSESYSTEAHMHVGVKKKRTLGEETWSSSSPSFDVARAAPAASQSLHLIYVPECWSFQYSSESAEYMCEWKEREGFTSKK